MSKLSISIIAIAPDEASARGLARTDAYRRGWIGTRITNLTQWAGGAVGQPVRGRPQFRYSVTIEADASRVSPSWAWSAGAGRDLRAGVRVRTTTDGENWTGGRRHVMPAGSVGTVVRRLAGGQVRRVSFADTPGRTFVYSPDALEIID